MTRVDRLDKRILQVAHTLAEIDAGRLAETIGCRPEVARDRLRRLREEGILRGFRPILDDSVLPAHRLLVIGIPSDQTTEAGVVALCDDPAVTRVYTMAAQASLAFEIRGDDLPALREQADALSQRAGLVRHQGILIVKTLHDAPEAGAAWAQADALTA